MRISKRDQILAAALRVVEHDGVSALTFESVAAVVEMTKGGLLYHFPTKDALLLALHEHLAEQWAADLRDTLGKPPETATAAERLAAYARVSARSATGPELRLMLEATSSPELDAPWRAVLSAWAPEPATLDANDPTAVRLMLARLAADGLWMADSLSRPPLPPQMRRALAAHIAESIGTVNRTTPTAKDRA